MSGAKTPSTNDLLDGADGRFLSTLVRPNGSLAFPGATAIEGLAPYREFLRLYLLTSDPLYRRLFAAALRKRFRGDALRPDQQRNQARELLAILRADATDRIDDVAAGASHQKIAHFFDELQGVLDTTAPRVCRALFIGDCVFQDILATLEEDCLADGVQVRASFIDTDNPARTRQQVMGISGTFDAVFYSPLTYEQSSLFRQVLDWRKAAMPEATFQRIIGQTLSEIWAVVGLLTAHTECPIFVQNTAAVRRHEGGPRELLKNALTLPLRRRARDEVNAGIGKIVAHYQATSVGPLEIIDEMRLLDDHSDDELGRFLYWSPLDHPASLGLRLATLYRDRIHHIAHPDW